MKFGKINSAMFAAFAVFSAIIVESDFCIAAEGGKRFASYGLGASSCGSYLSDIQKIKVAEDSYWNWLVGFLTAENLYVEGAADILGDVDRGVAISWIHSYCGRNPTATYQHAVANLSLYLSTKQNSDLRVPESLSLPLNSSPSKNIE
jgi:hypothetical protein